MTLENRSQAWIQAVRYIWNEGKIVYDKDERLKEVQNLVFRDSKSHSRKHFFHVGFGVGCAQARAKQQTKEDNRRLCSLQEVLFSSFFLWFLNLRPIYPTIIDPGIITAAPTSPHVGWVLPIAHILVSSISSVDLE